MIKLFFYEKSTLFLLCKEKKKEKKFETKFLKIIFFSTASSSLTASGAKQSIFRNFVSNFVSQSYFNQNIL